MTISIIIAVKTWQKNLEECVAKCQELDYSGFEIIILPDEEGTVSLPLSIHPGISIRVIATGSVNPAQKRDVALEYARGEILAFLDDDAYPRKDWLKNAVKNFTDKEVAAVGGPAVTPETDSLNQKASGEVYASILVSGEYIYRYIPGKKVKVDDYPSCNFLVRKSVMEILGGFNTNFWPGEDTKLCLDITKRLGKKIIYDPDVLVWHHRRALFLAHLRQIASYALHRGYFVKRLPETSLRFAYFIPSLLLISITFGFFLSFWFDCFRVTYLFALFSYAFLVFISSINKDLRLISRVFYGIILTHLTYGFYFIKGLITGKLKEEL